MAPLFKYYHWFGLAVLSQTPGSPHALYRIWVPPKHVRRLPGQLLITQVPCLMQSEVMCIPYSTQESSFGRSMFKTTTCKEKNPPSYV